jgi:hypothetical protein
MTFQRWSHHISGMTAPKLLAHVLRAVAVTSFITAFPVPSLADSVKETIGDLAISDFFVEPSFGYEDPNRGAFGPGHSYLEGQWQQRDHMVSASLKVGTQRLLGRPARYGIPDDPDELVLAEAYGQFEGVYGRLRAGLVPIAYGLEGGNSESRLRLTRSLLFRNRFVNLRDHGLTYRIENAGFFSDWALHNGESGTNLDNETWFTARWGWQGGKFLRAGFSGSTGRTSPESTNPRTVTTPSDLAELSAQAGLVVDRPAKLRFANAFLEWHDGRFRLQSEITAGDLVQDDGVRNLRAFYVDLEYLSSDSLSFLARYDRLDPHTGQDGNAQTETTLGLALRNRYETSVFSLFGTRIDHENHGPAAHRVLFVWRLTPTVRNRAQEL